ncbi:MAG: hypothetical protein QM722_24555 [Piscinibacter sp.]
MNPWLTMIRPNTAAWVRPAAPRAGSHTLPDIVLDETLLYRSECFAEDLQVASDAALAELFPMLRARAAAPAR